MRRALHFVFKIGDRAKTATFYRDVLGMTVCGFDFYLAARTREDSTDVLTSLCKARISPKSGTCHVVTKGFFSLNVLFKKTNASIHRRFYAMKNLRKAAKRRAMGM